MCPTPPTTQGKAVAPAAAPPAISKAATPPAISKAATVTGASLLSADAPSIPSFAAAHQGAPPEPPAPPSLGPARAPASADVGTPDDWVPRDERLIRLTGRHPLNCEPHLSDLLAAGFITPVALHFVRNHGATPRRAWDTHTLTVDGLVATPSTYSMDALVSLRPRRELAITFCCAGNRRKEQNLAAQTRGFSWGAGAVSTSMWTGIRLADLLERAGVVRGDPANARRHVRFTGPPGELPNGDGTYGTSIPLLKALDHAADVLVAYKQNGRWLAPDHGFPVRLILPGYIGGRTIKWLCRIEVAESESDNWYHFYDNRVFPPSIATPEDAEAAGAWHDPDYMINHFNINSAICEPAHDAVVPLSAGGEAMVPFKGYAYAGGGRKVTRVEVSLDSGSTWRPAAIHRMEPPTEHGMHWTWVFWSVGVSVADLAAAPAGDVQVRAADETMNTQPGRDACVWSLLGMQGNAHFAVRAVLEALKVATTAHGTGEALAPGSMVLRFQHPAPIQPGPLGNVGWREEEAAVKAGGAAGAVAAAPAPPAAASVTTRKVTPSELAAHAGDEGAAWFAYSGRVFDATRFLDDHPGGAESILISTGGDATADFDAIHSAKAKGMLEEYLVGELVEDEEEKESGGGGGEGEKARDAPRAPSTPPAGPPVALDPRSRRAFPLLSKAILSPNTRLFRFGLPAGHVLGLPVGKHVFLYGVPEKGGEVMRAYTPISRPDGETLDLLIKVYDDSLGGGVMSRWLDGLAIGDTVQAKGPVGHYEWTAPGACVLHRKPLAGVTRMTFIAAGTGITPAYAVLRAVFDPVADGETPPDTSTTAVLIYANRHEEDVLLAGELDGLARLSGGRFKVVYTLSRPGPTWPHARGRIDEAMIRSHALTPGEGAMAFTCGPPALVEGVVKAGLAAVGYEGEKVVVF